MTPQEIKTAREQAGLTQVQLAERMCVTSQTVSNWETGLYALRPHMVRLLQHVLGTSYDRPQDRT